MITKDDIINCYKYILGRNPESEQVIQRWLTYNKNTDFKILRKKFIYSKEVKDQYLKHLSVDSSINTPKEVKGELKKILRSIGISKDFAEVDINSSEILLDVIRKFDSGYESVYIVENGEWKGTVNLSEYRKIQGRALPILQCNYVSYLDDEEKLKQMIANVFSSCNWMEIPIISNRKLVYTARRRTIPNEKSWNMIMSFSKLHWNLISTNVIKKYFKKNSRVIISSDAGMLSGFKERFSFWLNVIPYEASMRFKKRKDDVLVYGVDIWTGYQIRKKWAKELFAELLYDTVVEYVTSHGVEFYYINTDYDKKLFKDRVGVNSKKWLDYRISPRNHEVNYCVSSRSTNDIDCEYSSNICSGMRITTESNVRPNRAIHCFGYCLVAGATTDIADETVESYLQELLNKEGVPYRVINYGIRAFAPDLTQLLNSLYFMLDTSFRPGDIVLLFSRGNRRAKNFYKATVPFLEGQYRDLNTFMPDGSFEHMLTPGRKAFAEYIYNIIKRNLLNKLELRDNKEHFCYLKDLGQPKPKDLQLIALLEKLPDLPNNALRVGALVLKADPFTRAHSQLVSWSLRFCDYLYVILIDSNTCYFSPEHRLAMLERNINNIDKVKILHFPSYANETYMWDGMLSSVVYRKIPNFMPINDAYIFTRWIAPRLNISIRFSGLEDYDINAKRCTRLMQDFFYNEGLEWEIFPRIKFKDGRDLSTEKVRGLIKEHKIEECGDYLTKETFMYLKELGI